MLQFDDLASIDYYGLREDCPELYLPEHLGTGGETDHLRVRVAEELKRANGNRTAAALKLGISRSTLWRWMKEQSL